MKKKNLIRNIAIIVSVSSLTVISGCSSSKPDIYAVDEYEGDFVYKDSKTAQKQVESKSKPYSEYSEEDWFYDYYDVEDTQPADSDLWEDYYSVD